MINKADMTTLALCTGSLKIEDICLDDIFEEYMTQYEEHYSNFELTPYFEEKARIRLKYMENNIEAKAFVIKNRLFRIKDMKQCGLDVLGNFKLSFEIKDEYNLDRKELHEFYVNDSGFRKIKVIYFENVVDKYFRYKEAKNYDKFEIFIIDKETYDNFNFENNSEKDILRVLGFID